MNLLFVCLGNICRSPMAEAVFRKKVQVAGLSNDIQVDSAGTGHWHIGKAPHEGTREMLQKNDIDHSELRARQINENDLKNFDLIVAMDASNLENVKMLGEGRGEVVRLLDYLPEGDVRDVPDPYFTGNFSGVYDMIDEACDRLLEDVRERWIN